MNSFAQQALVQKGRRQLESTANRPFHPHAGARPAVFAEVIYEQ